MIALAAALFAVTLSGRVTFNSVAVPGATVIATRDARTVTTTTDDDGGFSFANLENGPWTLRIEMRGFVTATRNVVVPLEGPLPPIALSLQSLADIVGRRGSAAVTAGPPPAEAVAAPADVDIVNGSVMNGAVTPFAQARAFGNNRPGGPPLYNGIASVSFGNSQWNARPYSFTGTNTPAPAFSDWKATAAFGGPLRIPGVVKYGPQAYVSYEHDLMHAATTHTAFVPSGAARAGDFSSLAGGIRDPLTGQPFAGGVIPADRIDPAARALLPLYPAPNTSSASGNYEAPIVAATTVDAIQASINGTRNRTTTLAASMAFRRTAIDATDLFAFSDRSRQSSLSLGGSWARRITPLLSIRARYEYTRESLTVNPFFANRTNVSGEAGITGNDQRPENWGPPALLFPDVLDLQDQDFTRTRRQAHATGIEMNFRHGNHTLTEGGDIRGLWTDVSSQPDPRGTITFTGELSGDAFADFLLGLPAASAIAFSGTTTRLRGAAYDVYINDDWRPRANLTLNLGVRWEYEAPFTEADNRLANLLAEPGFSSVQAVLSTPSNRSLIEPDKRGIEPRLAVSWRPSAGSPLVIRAGYGLYRNLGAYESLARLLAQQPPFSFASNVQTSRGSPLRLAAPFAAPSGDEPNTVAIDGRLRSAAAHTWQLSAQRELPASMTATAAYLGTKGNHLLQAFLPNTYPLGAVDPCASCPSGFAFVASGGQSLRTAAQFTLRRRLHNGFTASAQYTLAKAEDDASSFANSGVTIRSMTIAQNWLDLDAERGPSSFDQRHLLVLAMQFTSGTRVAGTTAPSSAWRSILAGWTIGMQASAGSGLPFTPVAFVSMSGSAFVGQRAALTGVPVEPVADGTYANRSAYAVPSPGTWGSAGRNSMRGPAQFTLDGSLARLIPLRGRMALEARLAATNLLNRVTFDAVDAVITSPQFGRPSRANQMRALLAGIRLRF